MLNCAEFRNKPARITRQLLHFATIICSFNSYQTEVAKTVRPQRFQLPDCGRTLTSCSFQPQTDKTQSRNPGPQVEPISLGSGPPYQTITLESMGRRSHFLGVEKKSNFDHFCGQNPPPGVAGPYAKRAQFFCSFMISSFCQSGFMKAEMHPKFTPH